VLAGLYVGVGTGVSTGKGMAVAVDGGCVAKSMGQGVGVGVGLSSSRGNDFGSTVGTRGSKATGVTSMGSGGFGVGVLQAIAVNSRIEENARHPALNRSINTTEKGAPLVL
jgi:hypothetical protein